METYAPLEYTCHTAIHSSHQPSLYIDPSNPRLPYTITIRLKELLPHFSHLLHSI